MDAWRTRVTPLPEKIRDQVLTFFGLTRSAPTHAFLAELLAAYVRRVPWETASRIVRRANTQETAACPRWPVEFWQEALQRNGGGTCYESNYAFFSLLTTLGYEGYLTLNNMGESVGCHSAIVLRLNKPNDEHGKGQRWLVDVGLPVYALLPLNPNRPTSGKSPFHTYTLRPSGEHRYEVERDRHPKPNCFTLLDEPVPDAHYRRVTMEDYGDAGQFLKRVIITKVVEDVPWRFSSADEPLRLESFPNSKRVDYALEDEVAARVANHFSMDVSIVRQALSFVLATA